MKLNWTWYRYPSSPHGDSQGGTIDDPKARLPERGEWILCLRIDGAEAITFDGYFQKDYSGTYDYVFVYGNDKTVDGESIHIDYWVPIATIFPKG